MTYARQLDFELFVINLCENEECKTAKDYERLSEALHESIENAIQDVCMDEGIENYDPLY